MYKNRFQNIRNNYNMNSQNINVMQQPEPEPEISNSVVTSSESYELISQNKEISILDLVSVYDNNNTECFIKNISDEYEEQCRINNILKKKDFEKNKKQIETFVKENNIQIKNQLEQIEDIFSKLKVIHEENQLLHEEQKHVNELDNSEEVKNVAQDMRNLKNLKTKIQNFLYQNGIRLN